MPDVDRLPLFLLPLAAVPGEEVPLHVFEPRYQRLVEQCLTSDAEFGVLLVGDGGARDIGCAARIVRVVSREDDGRLDMITRGTRRFRLAGEITEDEFPAAPVDWLTDEPRSPHDEPDPDEVLELFAQLAERVTGSVPDLEADEADETSFRIAARVAFGGDAKQGLIELRSESRRLKLLARLLRAALSRLSQVELREAAARSNGKVHFD